MKKIFLIKDYRGAFYSKVENIREFCSLDILKIKALIEKKGFIVEILDFSELAKKDVIDSIVIYTSSEDNYGLYKNYIESVLMNIDCSLLLPNINFLKAHHNKVAMEMLRNKLLPEQEEIFETEFFGTHEEIKNKKIISNKWPKVFKLSFGAGAKGVALAQNKKDLLKISKKLTRTYFLKEVFFELIARLRRKNYIRRSLNRQSFIIQNFIPNLLGDYKVLVYGKKYYILKRNNRPNDFRASGSGLFEFDLDNEFERDLILDYAYNIHSKLDTPLLSLDIAVSSGVPYLIEFQAICFGTLTAEKSKKYYTKINNKWEVNMASTDVEEEFVNAVIDYIDIKFGNL